MKNLFPVLKLRYDSWRHRLRIQRVRALVCDVDGVLTDGSLLYDSKGNIFKSFNVKDGLGIRLLQSAGIEVAFLSGGSGGAIDARANDLDVKHCIVRAKDKSRAIQELASNLGLDMSQVAYLGDDINDLPTRSCISLLASTADAVNELKRFADLRLTKAGGKGAVRELAHVILSVQENEYPSMLRNGWTDHNG